jgi:hypothetical protein
MAANDPSCAADVGSAAQAKEMPLRVVAAIETDRDAALARFGRSDNGLRGPDLYVLRARNDGKVAAYIDFAQIGRIITDLYDIDGVRRPRERRSRS